MSEMHSKDSSEKTERERTNFFSFLSGKIKSESLHLFKDDENFAPRLNLSCSFVFYIVALFIVVSIPAYFRCSLQKNQVGVQKLTSVSDCDNLLLVTCKNSCGRFYGEYDEMSLSYAGGVITTQGAVLFYAPDNYCATNGHGSLGQYSIAVTRIKSPLTSDWLWPLTIVFHSQQECMESCSLLAIGNCLKDLSGTMASCDSPNVGYPMIASVDCSCTKVPTCSCDSANIKRGPELAVTDAETCKKSFLDVSDPPEGSADVSVRHEIAFPLEECVGVLNELLVCDSALTTIGVIGGYLSIIFSSLIALFSFGLSWERSKDSEYKNELELEIVD